MANNKRLPDIQGTETIANTWQRLLERDRNISNLFSGTDFTTDQSAVDDIGRPLWRTDLNRLFIWNGQIWLNLFNLIEPYEISYTIDHPDVPSTVVDLKGILDLIVQRNNLNTVTLPADSVSYTADGTTSTFALPRYTNNKSSCLVFIDGVKQETSTYTLSSDGLSITFGVIPARGERIEIVHHASIVEWDYSPSIEYFTGNGSNKVFTVTFDLLSAATTSVNVAGTELQKNQFTVDGRKVTLATAPANNAKVQISTVGKTSFVTVSQNSIGTEELKNNSVTADKLATDIPVNVNSIANSAIVTRMIADSNVTAAKIANSAITSAKINNGAVSEDKLATAVKNKLLATNSVTTAMIVDGNVTAAKLAPGIMNNYYTKAEVDALIAALRQELSS